MSAIAVPPASWFPLVFGLRLPILLVCPLVVLWAPLLWFFNRRIVKEVEKFGGAGEKPSLAILGGRVAFALAGALVVAYATTLWVFGGDIETEVDRVSAELAAWHEKDQPLRGEKKIKEEERDELEGAERRSPPVEQDPDVMSLQQRLDQTRASLREAELTAICEHDGTCGTGDPGDGPDYRLRVEDRENLRRSEADIAAQLESRKGALKQQADQLALQQEGVKTRIAKIDEDLKVLGPPPPGPSRPAAWSAVADQKRVPMAGVLIGVMCVFLVVDLLALLLGVCRIGRHSGNGQAGPPLKQLFRQQGEKDTARVRDEYMQEFYTLPEGRE